MNYSKIEILGLRGFDEKRELNLAIPNGKQGSGFTVIVGPNNSGKSTIFEAFRVISQNNPASFTEGKRNKKAGDKVQINIYSGNNKLSLQSEKAGGSETEFVEHGLDRNKIKFFTVPSRRSFSPFFSKAIHDRNQYIDSLSFSAERGSQLNNFFARIFNIQKNQNEFNSVLGKVLDFIPKWHIEQSDNGNHYIKFDFNDSFHNSDGIGEGLLSIFTIVDALYDSSENNLIFIDEPELSLHPALQKKLLNLFLEYSEKMQIVITTHSPYFISWLSIENGGKISRTSRETNGIQIYQFTEDIAKKLISLVKNLNNPHILGLDAREIFFLDDNLILMEGQEDVIFFNKILAIKKVTLPATFFGWGMGGAHNTEILIEMLKEIGFKKIVIILDNNMSQLAEDLQTKFPEFKFVTTPSNDIRDKPAKNDKPAIEGMIDSKGEIINTKYENEINKILLEINTYF